MEGETARMVTKSLTDIMAIKTVALKHEQKVYIEVAIIKLYKHKKVCHVLNMSFIVMSAVRGMCKL